MFLHLPVLSVESLSSGSLPPHIKKPNHNLVLKKTGIVHFGAGRFFLAHLAPWINEVLQDDPNWGIHAVSLFTPTMIDALAASDNIYCLVERSDQGNNISVIGSIVDGSFAPRDPRKVIDLVASDQTHMVTLTVTQHGYYLNGSGSLDLTNCDIEHDLECLTQPRTVIGYIVAGLRQRANSGGSKVSVISCDNLPKNGMLLRQVILMFASRIDPLLTSWIEQNVYFPVTMVDRITPKLNEADYHRLTEITGIQSSVTIVTEPFRQFVVDRLPPGLSPPWQNVGVQVVEDATPFWDIKFHILNAGHSVVAIPGARLGYQYIAEAMQDEVILDLLQRAHREFCLFLGNVHEDYLQSVCQRFRDKAMHDAVERVGSEGTRKVPKYIISSICRGLKECGVLSRALTLVVAIWILNLSEQDEAGREINLLDPKAITLKNYYHSILKTIRKVSDKVYLSDSIDQNVLNDIMKALNSMGIFGELVEHEEFLRTLCFAMMRVDSVGLRKAMRSYF